MIKTHASIFNDVLGPVITGPSSSNTCGAARITQIIRFLMPDFKKATIAVNEGDGFGHTLQGMKSGVAFVAGLMGFPVDDRRIAVAREIAKERGLDVRFTNKDLVGEYFDMVEVTLENGVDAPVVVLAASIGAGMVEIVTINGVPVKMTGDAFELLINSKKPISKELKDYVVKVIQEDSVFIEDTMHASDEGEIYEVRIEKALSPAAAAKVKEAAAKEGALAFFIDAILTVSAKKDQKLPFHNCREMEEYLEKTGKNMFEAGVDYEMARSGWSREEILKYAEHIITVMREAAEEGLKGDFEMSGFATPKAGQIKQATLDRKIIPCGTIEQATYYAVAVMELNSGMGRIVAAPTAGSAGIMPGTLLSTVDALNIPMEKAVEALMVGGVIGLFIAEQANFSGADCGCQAEVASACSMAAATACYLIGGTTKQICCAAALAIQNLLGLICDPIGSFPEIPCINRNPMGCANAITMANLAIGGYDAVIPLDEVIVTMRVVGESLPKELRCSGGGLCGSPTGKCLAAKLEKEKVFAYEI